MNSPSRSGVVLREYHDAAVSKVRGEKYHLMELIIREAEALARFLEEVRNKMHPYDRGQLIAMLRKLEELGHGREDVHPLYDAVIPSDMATYRKYAAGQGRVRDDI